MARPISGKYIISDMIKKIDDYTEKASLPILKECCLECGWNYDTLMGKQAEFPMLKQSISRLHMKREVVLEKGMHGGKLNVALGMFSLKQPVHGWKDRHFEDVQDGAMVESVGNILVAIREAAKKNAD